MKIKEKIYPYPVIKEKDADYKDYKKATFDFDILIDDKTNQLTIKTRVDSIPKKLEPGKTNYPIEYGYQIESTMNKNRKFYMSKEPELSIQLNPSEYTGNVEINAYIIASENLEIDFNSRIDNVDDFYNGVVHFPKGGIIAVARPTKAIDVGLNGSMPNNPIRIVKDDSVEGIRYTIDNSQIKIGLSKKNHDIYVRFGKDKQITEFIFSSVVTPAVSKAILELSQEQKTNGSINEDSDWKESFKNKLEANDVHLTDIGESITVEEATQIVLNNPIDKVFNDLNKYGENNDE